MAVRERERISSAPAARLGLRFAFLLKTPRATEHGRIFYHDIGDNLKTKEKLSRIAAFRSIAGVREKEGWRQIIPDRYGDWINQRDKRFESFLRLGSKTSVPETTLFSLYSLGVVTNRDAWCYNSSKIQLKENISRTIAFYNAEVQRWRNSSETDQKNFIIRRDPKAFSWTRALETDLKRSKLLDLEDGVTIQSLYRPFTKRWLHYSRRLNEMVYQMPSIFPEPGIENRGIIVNGTGFLTDFSCLMTDCIPDVNLMIATQCFPLWKYRKIQEGSLVEEGKDIVEGPSGRRYIREYAVTEKGLEEFRREYPELWITPEDVFLYAYGLFHSAEYRVRFGSNLSKELPRLPLMRTWKDFETFREAGKALAELHTNYETVEPYPVTVAQGDFLTMIEEPETFYRVTKMKFAQKQQDNKKVKDKTSIIYNNNITLRGIPLEAYEYVVNGKSAVDWVMGRQGVSVDKASGIMSDGNLYGIETVGDPSYPLRLLERVIMVSLETLRIVKGLPLLELKE